MKKGVRIKGVLPTKSNKFLSRKRRKNDSFASKMANNRLLFPCNFCTRLFPTKKKHSAHARSCSAKKYIRLKDHSIDKEQNSLSRKKIENEQVDIKTNPTFEFKNNLTSLPVTIQKIKNSNETTGLINSGVVTDTVLKEKNSTTRNLDQSEKRPSAEQAKVTNGAKGDSETVCWQCDKDCGTALDRLRHSRTVHFVPTIRMSSSEIQKYYSVKDRSKCPICHKVLRANYMSVFIKHLQTHTSESRYTCVICKQKFRRLDHMRQHEKRHIVTKKRK